VERACHLVRLLGLSPRQVAAALEQSMTRWLETRPASALTRVRLTRPSTKRRQMLEAAAAAGDAAQEEELRAWHEMIAAVAALPDLDASGL
jgi:hypothetical protein